MSDPNDPLGIRPLGIYGTADSYKDTHKGVAKIVDTSLEGYKEIATLLPSNRGNKSLYDDYLALKEKNPDTMLANVVGTAMGASPNSVGYESLTIPEKLDNALPQKLEEKGVHPLLAMAASPSNLLPFVKGPKMLGQVSKVAKAAEVANDASKAAKAVEATNDFAKIAREMNTSVKAREAYYGLNAADQAKVNEIVAKGVTAEPAIASKAKAPKSEKLPDTPESLAAEAKFNETKLKNETSKKLGPNEFFDETGNVIPSYEDVISSEIKGGAKRGEAIAKADSYAITGKRPAPAESAVAESKPGFWQKVKDNPGKSALAAAGAAGLAYEVSKKGKSGVEADKKTSEPPPPAAKPATKSIDEPEVTDNDIEEFAESFDKPPSEGSIYEDTASQDARIKAEAQKKVVQGAQDSFDQMEAATSNPVQPDETGVEIARRQMANAEKVRDVANEPKKRRSAGEVLLGISAGGGNENASKMLDRKSREDSEDKANKIKAENDLMSNYDRIASNRNASRNTELREQELKGQSAARLADLRHKLRQAEFAAAVATSPAEAEKLRLHIDKLKADIAESNAKAKFYDAGGAAGVSTSTPEGAALKKAQADKTAAEADKVRTDSRMTELVAKAMQERDAKRNASQKK